MVLYLGIDFLQQAVSRQKKFLSEATLTVPQHLNSKYLYPHLGCLYERKYRWPWKRASVEVEFLDSEKLKIHNSFMGMIPLKKSKNVIEKYGCETDTGTGNFHLYCDMVCSPTTSPDLFEEVDVIFGTDGQTSADEIFDVVDLSEFVPMGNGECMKLTEIFCKSSDVGICHLPSLQKMVSHLQPKILKDPLINCSRIQSWLYTDRYWEPDSCLETHDTNNESSCTPAYCFPIEDFFTIQEDEVAQEELMSPKCPTYDLDSSSYLYLDSSTLKTELEIHEKDLTSEPEDIFIEHVQRLDTFVGVETSMETFDIKRDVTERHYWEHFLQVKQTGDDNTEETFISKVTVDTPITDMKSDINRTELILPDINLQPFPISRVHEKLLKPEKKETILWKVLQYEQFFDEILHYRLPVPDVYVKLSSCLEAPVIPNTECEEMNIGKQELALNWSLKPNIESFHLDVSVMEKMTFKKDCQSPHKNDSCISQETWEKYEESDVKDNQDLFSDLLGTCTSNHNEYYKQKTKSNSKETKPEKKGFTRQSEPSVNKFGFDPINDFLMMRTNSLETNAEHNNMAATGQNANTNTGCNTATDLTDENLNLPVPTLKKHKRKSKIKVLTLKMTGKYKEILNLIESQAEIFMPVLKQSGELSSHSFKKLTPGLTRFLLTQKEQAQQITSQDMECYKASVAVDVLCNARDILYHCCLESTLQYIGQMEEKYQDYLAGCLQELHQTLFHFQVQCQQQLIHHPKMISICREVEKKLKKYSMSQDMKHEMKVLIILKRNLSSLVEYITEVLSTGNVVKAQYIEDGHCEGIIQSLDHCNTLVLLGGNIGHDFPWSQFSLVVEYESTESRFCDLCSRQSIRYMSFNIGSEDSMKNTSLSESKTSSCQIPCTVIGSQSLLCKMQLLQILETRYNMTILERDFSVIRKTVPCADLIIDERSCIILHSLSDLSDSKQVETLIKRVLGLNLEFDTCWLICYNLDGTSKRYHLGGATVSNLFNLNAAICNYTSKNIYFQAKVAVCSDVNKVAEVIQKACNARIENSVHWKSEDWEKRLWLSNTMSKQERFLLAFPCLNSFSAQWMLQKFSVKLLLSKSLPQLCEDFPEIPQRYLKMFVEIIESNTGLQLWNETRTNNADMAYTDFTGDEKDTYGYNFNAKIPSLSSEYMLVDKQNQRNLQQVDINMSNCEIFGCNEYKPTYTGYTEESESRLTNKNALQVPKFRKDPDVRRNEEKSNLASTKYHFSNIQTKENGNPNIIEREDRDSQSMYFDSFKSSNDFKAANMVRGMCDPMSKAETRSTFFQANSNLQSSSTMTDAQQLNFYQNQFQDDREKAHVIRQNQRHSINESNCTQRNKMHLQDPHPNEMSVTLQKQKENRKQHKIEKLGRNLNTQENYSMNRNVGNVRNTGNNRNPCFQKDGHYNEMGLYQYGEHLAPDDYIRNSAFGPLRSKQVQSNRPTIPAFGDMELDQRMLNKQRKVHKSVYGDQMESNLNETFDTSPCYMQKTEMNPEMSSLQDLKDSRNGTLQQNSENGSLDLQMVKCKKNLLSMGKPAYLHGFPSSVFQCSQLNETVATENNYSEDYNQTQSYSFHNVSVTTGHPTDGSVDVNIIQQQPLRENQLCKGSFEDNLKETTRNILRRVTLPCDRTFHRLPPHRISIGLAQPLRRNDSSTREQDQSSGINKDKIQSCVDTEVYNRNQDRDGYSAVNQTFCTHKILSEGVGQKNHIPPDTYPSPACMSDMFELKSHASDCMLQEKHFDGSNSLWHSYSSPPMDLDPCSPDCQEYSPNINMINEHSNIHSMRSTTGPEHRPSFTFRSTKGKTLNKAKDIKQSIDTKKRRLTYSYTPKCKSGQTKLVFT